MLAIFFQKMRYLLFVLILLICSTEELIAAPTCFTPPTWTQLFPATSPPARGSASMADDSATGQLILFGGNNGAQGFTGNLNDTWNWNGTTWTQLFPATSPPSREGASMAYDSATGQLILFGGNNVINQRLNDTWNWDGTTWMQLFPATSPPARDSASLAFDPATGQLILFGGFNNVLGELGDTWNWDGTTWVQLSPATSPPARGSASMAFDPATGQLILFGGFNNVLGELGDTWNWDGTTWTQLFPATSPPARSGASLAFDPATGQLILFGGDGNSGALNDTWNWDGTTWTQLSPATPPPARADASMAFDSTTDQLILFGGFGSSGILNDTWNWGGIPIPGPVATATPSSQTITSGSPTSIKLSSNVPGTTFSWTVVENGVTGASSGSGSSIVQVLFTTTFAPGTATYTITPTSPAGCVGAPIIVVVTVRPLKGPKHFRGEIKYNKFASQTDIVHVLSWQPSPDCNVIGYKVFQDHKLIKTLHGRNVDKLKLHNRKKDKIYHYEIVAFSASGVESKSVKLTL